MLPILFLQESVSALFILQNRSTSHRCTVIHVILKEILYCLLLLWLPRRVIDRVSLETMACIWAFRKIYSRISGMFHGGQIFIQVYSCISTFLDKKENSSFYIKVIQIIHYKLQAIQDISSFQNYKRTYFLNHVFSIER